MMKICSHCGGQIEKDDAKFCNLCGEEFEQEKVNKFCNKCGNEITDLNAKFCINCGGNIVPKNKKAQRGGCAIAGFCIPWVVISLLPGFYKSSEEDIWIWGAVSIVATMMALLLSIAGKMESHGFIKVLSIFGIIVSCIALILVVINMSMALEFNACTIPSESSSSYDYYDYYY